jgi:hypothetical protein
MELKVGDIVEYIDDWKPNRQWYLYSIQKGGLCTIIVIRDGKYTHEKQGQEYINANIVNLPVEEITKI